MAWRNRFICISPNCRPGAIFRGLGGLAGVPIADQLQRAGTSISLNIAEGSGEFSVNEKSRFYRMAKRSATESAAILDVAKRLNIIHEADYRSGRDLLIRIVSMLTKMAQRTN